MAEKEYIERETIEKAFAEEIRTNYLDDYAKGFQAALLAIMSIPSTDVAPVRHAKWELIDECINEGVYCSNCHKKIYRARAEYANQKVKSNYCPNCGAKMDGKEDDKNAKL